MSNLKMGRTTSEELIPREVLFGNPEYAAPALSPDGKLLAFLKPEQGVLNIFVRTVGSTQDRLVTNDSLRGIRGVSWAQDSKTLLFSQDVGGDENFHLYAIDATTEGAIAVDLTPFKGAKAQNIITNKRFPLQLLVGINKRDVAKFDMYRVDLTRALAGDAEGALTLDTENPGYITRTHTIQYTQTHTHTQTLSLPLSVTHTHTHTHSHTHTHMHTLT